MAHTTVTKAYSANTGAANTYSYSGSFDVFKGTEVAVELDNVALTYTASTINESASPREYTVDTTAKTIHVGGATLSSGTLILRPETDMGSPTARATYSPGASITSADLNNNQLQLMRKAMEYNEQKLSTTGGTMTGDLTMGEDQTIIFEGATDDAYETTLTVTDPTADRTITLPNVTGTVVTTGDTATVTATMLAANSVDSSELVDGSIDASHIGADQVTTAKIADSNVTTAKIANDAITGAKIADDSIDSEHLVADSIDAEHYGPGTVDTTALGADAVTGAKVADDAIDSEHYTDGSIDTAHIADLNVTTAKIAADAITGAKVADDAIDSEHYTDGSIDTAHLAADAVTGAKIADDALDSEHYTDGSIDTAHLAADCVTGAKIADDALDSEHYTDGSIDAAHIASNAVTTAKINADAVTGAKIADDALDSEHYTDGSIDAAHLASDSVTTAKIADDAVTFAKIGCEQTTISDTDTSIPTSGAVVDYVAAAITPLGGFEAIATEDVFPTTVPAAGVIVSIADATEISVNSSGVATNCRTDGNGSDNVTINGFPSILRGGVGSNADPYILPASSGLLVVSTGSSHTYNYHRLVATTEDIKLLSDTVESFKARYRVASSAPGSDNTDGDIYYNTSNDTLYVYDGSQWEESVTTTPGDDTVTGAKIVDDAIDSEHYTDGSIDTAHLAADAITGAKIADDSIDSEHYVDGSIDTAHLAADAVTGAKVADDAIDSEHYVDGSIDAAHIASNAVTTAKINADAVTGAKVADDAIDSEHYTDGSIDTAHIADDQVTLAKMAGLARGKIIYGDSSGNPAALAIGTSGYTLISDGTDISWGEAAAGAAGGGSDKIFWENGQTVTTNYTITNNTNAGTFGPVTINAGVTVTIGSGEYWVII